MLHSLTGSRGGLQGEYLIWTWCLSQSPPPILLSCFSILVVSTFLPQIQVLQNGKRICAGVKPIVILSCPRTNLTLLRSFSRCPKCTVLPFFFLHLWMDVVLWYLYCVQCCISVFMTRGVTGGKTWSLDLSLWRIDDGCHYSWVPIVTFWMTECLKWKSEDCESENVNLMFLPQKKVDVGFLFLCV